MPVGLAAGFGLSGGVAQAALTPVVTETGRITLSVDGLGSIDPEGGTIQVEKPSADATVESAHFACASLGTSGEVIDDEEVTIDGTGITWDIDAPSAINSFNHLADVTDLVGPKIDAAPAGRVDFTIVESSPILVDGCVLAVIFDDPAVDVDRTAILLFGAQETGGDTFPIELAEPIDLDDTDLVLDFGLGISFGFQGQPANTDMCGIGGPDDNQFSIVDVNGQRLTSCAGNADDGEGEPVGNGALLTVGGLDDSNANPDDPFQQPGDATTPRIVEDELYSLIPFVSEGDTLITVNTSNPSMDDNIFFAHLFTSGRARIAEAPLAKQITSGLDTDEDGNIDLAVEVPQTESLPYGFTITVGPELIDDEFTGLLVLDTVPAEWDVVCVYEDDECTPGDPDEEVPDTNPDGQGLGCGESATVGLVDLVRGGTPGDECRSRTRLAWTPDDEEASALTVELQSRPRGDQGFFAPTRCGALLLNRGAVLIDEPTGNILAETGPLVVAAVEDRNDGGIVANGSGDEDEDGRTDFDEVRDPENASNPCNPERVSRRFGRP